MSLTKTATNAWELYLRKFLNNSVNLVVNGFTVTVLKEWDLITAFKRYAYSNQNFQWEFPWENFQGWFHERKSNGDSMLNFHVGVHERISNLDSMRNFHWGVHEELPYWSLWGTYYEDSMRNFHFGFHDELQCGVHEELPVGIPCENFKRVFIGIPWRLSIWDSMMNFHGDSMMNIKWGFHEQLPFGILSGTSIWDSMRNFDLGLNRNF